MHAPLSGCPATFAVKLSEPLGVATVILPPPHCADSGANQRRPVNPVDAEGCLPRQVVDDRVARRHCARDFGLCLLGSARLSTCAERDNSHDDRQTRENLVSHPLPRARSSLSPGSLTARISRLSTNTPTNRFKATRAPPPSRDQERRRFRTSLSSCSASSRVSGVTHSIASLAALFDRVAERADPEGASSRSW